MTDQDRVNSAAARHGWIVAPARGAWRYTRADRVVTCSFYEGGAIKAAMVMLKPVRGTRKLTRVLAELMS